MITWQTSGVRFVGVLEGATKTICKYDIRQTVKIQYKADRQNTIEGRPSKLTCLRYYYYYYYYYIILYYYYYIIIIIIIIIINIIIIIIIS